ncbi:MAG: SPOR domain-containing protein [Candidatus Omnitrophota bacterium]
MDKESGLQLELFSGADNGPLAASREKSYSHFKRLRNYERTLLMIIGIAATAIISFSFGVEKGRNLSLLQNNPRFDIGIQTPQVLPQQAKNKEAPVTVQPKSNIKIDEGGKPLPQEKIAFTIQLASYKTKAYAEKEAKALKKKGLFPLILTKGNYIVLCVGSFRNKENALSLLTQLEKKYNGCRIRRL